MRLFSSYQYGTQDEPPPEAGVRGAWTAKLQSIEETMTMSEQPPSKETDLRTDAQKFEDALRTVLTTPKETVQKRMDAEREQRKQQTAASVARREP